MFRYKKGIPLPYEVQGYIYFYSRRFDSLSPRDQKCIREVCREAGGEYAQALMEFVTRDTGAVKVCARYYLSEKSLERAVKEYYCLMAKRI